MLIECARCTAYTVAGGDKGHPEKAKVAASKLSCSERFLWRAGRDSACVSMLVSMRTWMGYPICPMNANTIHGIFQLGRLEKPTLMLWRAGVTMGGR